MGFMTPMNLSGKEAKPTSESRENDSENVPDGKECRSHRKPKPVLQRQMF
jgi:hypothetical protein